MQKDLSEIINYWSIFIQKIFSEINKPITPSSPNERPVYSRLY